MLLTQEYLCEATMSAYFIHIHYPCNHCLIGYIRQEGPDPAFNCSLFLAQIPMIFQMYFGAIKLKIRQANRIAGPVHSNCPLWR